MVTEHGKPPNEKSSYRPTFLLPIISKLLLKRLRTIVEEKQCILTHSIGFRSKYSTIEQVHRITDVIEWLLEQKKICTTIFLDVTQAFDKVWHESLINKRHRLINTIQNATTLVHFPIIACYRVSSHSQLHVVLPVRSGAIYMISRFRKFRYHEFLR